MTVIARMAQRRNQILSSVARSFPRASVDSAEDAVAHAFEVVIRDPSLLAIAEGKGGDARCLALMRRIAWRAMRAEWRRPRNRRELVTDDLSHLPNLSNLPDQSCMEWRWAVESLLEPAARRFGHHRHGALRRALHDRILHEHTDAEAGAAHHVPREYVNRARHWMAHQLAA